MQKIIPFLWFNNCAEAAISFYASIFKNTTVHNLTHWGDGSPFPPTAVRMAVFELEGQQYYAMDAGPMYQFSEAISMFVHCEDQAEVDYFWERLTADGGAESRCGWCKDKFGISWQVIPKQLSGLISKGKAMQAMLQMNKIIIADLEKAAGE